MNEIIIEPALRDMIQAKSIELSGLERLIAFAMSNTEYTVPQEKIDELMTKYSEINAEYELAKAQVSAIVKEVSGKEMPWNLDFESRKVTY